MHKLRVMQVLLECFWRWGVERADIEECSAGSTQETGGHQGSCTSLGVWEKEHREVVLPSHFHPHEKVG